MCRIFGYIGTDKISEEILAKVSRLQIHGGPDQQGFIQKEYWALGNNRLAIQGLDGGVQPFCLDNNIWAVFNGEIYNHRTLRKKLINSGYAFNDNCDGSIIPALYREYGLDFVRHLDGMFAIGIIDLREEPKLILATDPAGIKSVYYYWDETRKTLKFSSELPSLLGFVRIDVEIRPQAMDDYLSGRAIWGPKTIFENVYTIPPSSLLISKLNKAPHLISYQSLIASENPHDLFDEAAKSLDIMLDKEIKAMMLADVPVCVVTSGGLDSSYVTSLAKKYCDNLHSFNISYEGNFPSDERHFAEEVAKACGTHHHQIEIAEKDFPRLMGKMIQHIGQPNSAPHSLSTYALFEAIHKEGFKVALTGEGADEFFSGYKRYSSAAFDVNSDWLPRYLDKMSVSPRSMREEIYSPAYRAFISERDTLFNKASRDILHYESLDNNRLSAVLKFDQTQRFPYYILRRVDHLSMASSVEVRVPFCQPRIIDFSQKLKNDFKVRNAQDKFILYKAAEGKIPLSVLSRPKQPFTLPVVAMFRKGHVLFDMMHATLNSRHFIERDIFDPAKLNLLINRQLSNPEEKTAETLWSLMVFELWLRETA